jgi:trehalose 6-phosphate synthase
MNLVAHEYAAARTHEDGVLILSEFAGAAKHLKGAILVNPYDGESFTNAIHRALTMKASEKRKRMRSLRAEVMRLDVHRWADGYLSALESK